MINNLYLEYLLINNLWKVYLLINNLWHKNNARFYAFDAVYVLCFRKTYEHMNNIDIYVGSLPTGVLFYWQRQTLSRPRSEFAGSRNCSPLIWMIWQILNRSCHCLWRPDNPANTRHRTNVGPLLVHRLRRCPNIGPALGRYLVLAGNDTRGGGGGDFISAS